MELGGNDPSVLFSDIDIEPTVKMLVNFKMMNNGQVCCSAKRIFIHASIYEQVKSALLLEIENLRNSDRFAKGILYGSDAIENTLQDQLHRWKKAQGQGAKMLRGDWEQAPTQDITVIEVNGRG